MSKDPSFDCVCNHRDALADENSVLKQQNTTLAMAFEGVDPLFLRPGFVLSKVQEVDALHLLIARERQQRDELLAIVELHIEHVLDSDKTPDYGYGNALKQDANRNGEYPEKPGSRWLTPRELAIVLRNSIAKAGGDMTTHHTLESLAQMPVVTAEQIVRFRDAALAVEQQRDGLLDEFRKLRDYLQKRVDEGDYNNATLDALELIEKAIAKAGEA